MTTGLLSIAEVADELHIKERTLYDQLEATDSPHRRQFRIGDAVVPVVRFGSRWKVNAATLAAALDQRVAS